MVIDELVSVLRFELSPTSKTALDKLEGGLKTASRTTAELGGSLGKLNPQTDGLMKSLGNIGGALSSVAIGAAAAGAGLVATLGALTLAEGKQANTLNNLAGSIGLNASELSVWSAAMRSAGLNADSLKGDLAKLAAETDALSFDDILAQADELKSLSLPEAMVQGQAWGLSEDTVHFLHQGADAIRDALEKASQQGQGALQGHLDNLQSTYKEYRNLSETISGVVTKIAGENAPRVGAALGELNGYLTENKDRIDGWSKDVGDGIDSVVEAVKRLPAMAKSAKQYTGDFLDAMDYLAEQTNHKLDAFVVGLTGKLDKAESRISKFNDRPTKENVNSPSPLIRKMELEEREESTFYGVLGAVTGGMKDVFTSERPSKAIEALGKRWDSIVDHFDQVSEAADVDWKMKNPDLPQTGKPADDWFAGYRKANTVPEMKMPDVMGGAKEFLSSIAKDVSGAFDSVAGLFSPTPIVTAVTEQAGAKAKSLPFELPEVVDQVATRSQPAVSESVYSPERFGAREIADAFKGLEGIARPSVLDQLPRFSIQDAIERSNPREELAPFQYPDVGKRTNSGAETTPTGNTDSWSFSTFASSISEAVTDGFTSAYRAIVGPSIADEPTSRIPALPEFPALQELPAWPDLPQWPDMPTPKLPNGIGKMFDRMPAMPAMSPPQDDRRMSDSMKTAYLPTYKYRSRFNNSEGYQESTGNRGGASSRGGRSDGGGVHVENQNVAIHIDGAGDPVLVAEKTVSALNIAATSGDSEVPFFR